jgi:hypothetical protein
MAIPVYLQQFKAAGIYRVTFDKSTIAGVDAETLRLVVGYSEKGPFNIPTYIRSVTEFQQVYGGVNKRMEKRGNFFHRMAIQALGTGPILALNLKKFSNESVGAITIDPKATESPIMEAKLKVEDIYDTTKFWEIDTNQLNGAQAYDSESDSYISGKKLDKYISFAATDVKSTSSSIFIRKSNVSGYDITVKDWYADGLQDMPDWLIGKESTRISDYMVEVYVFKGQFTKDLMVSDTFSNYFNLVVKDGKEVMTLKPYILNSFGDAKDTLEELYKVSEASPMGKYVGCLIPDFLDKQGKYISIDRVFNNDQSTLKLECFMNADMLDNEVITDLNVNGVTSLTLADYKTLYGKMNGGSFAKSITSMSQSAIDPAIAKEVRSISSFTPVTKSAGTAYQVPVDTIDTDVIADIVKNVSTDGVIDILGPLKIIDASVPGGTTPATFTFANITDTVNEYKTDTVVTGFVQNANIKKGTNYISLDITPVKGITKETNVSLTIAGTSTTFVAPASLRSNTLFYPATATEASATVSFKLIPGQTTSVQINNKDLITGKTVADITGITISSVDGKTTDDLVVTIGDTLTIAQGGGAATTGSATQVDFVSTKTLADDTTNYLAITVDATATDLIAALQNLVGTDTALINIKGINFTKATSSLQMTKTTTYGTRTITWTLATPTGQESVGEIPVLYYPVTSAELANSKTIISENLYKAGWAKGDRFVGVDASGNTIETYISSVKDTYSLTANKDGLWAYVNGSLKLLTPAEKREYLYGKDGVWYTPTTGNLDGGVIELADSDKSGDLSAAEIKASFLKLTVNVDGTISTDGASTATNINELLSSIFFDGVPAKIITFTDSLGVVEISDNDKYIVKIDGPLTYQIGTMTPTYLEGYTYAHPLPVDADGSPTVNDWYCLQWQKNYVLGALTEYKGLRTALLSKASIEYRYIVDTLQSYVDEECKSVLSNLAKEKQSALAILNFPSVNTFRKCTYASFLDSKGLFNVDYVVAGCNKKKSATVSFSLPSDVDGASFCAFYSPLKFSDGSVSTYVPSAALVSNNFMTKYTSRQPYYIVAGQNYGLITASGLVGPDYNYSNDELQIIEPFGVNVMMYRPRVGTFINANQTAKQSPKSALSHVHVRELVIYIQDEIEKILQLYQWEFNTPTVRNLITDRANAICENVKNNGGLNYYLNVMDESNNTNDIIDNEMCVLSTHIEPTNGAGKMVQELTIYRTGQLSSITKE